ncbi:hypothetical protein [Myxosarcina sp. GI1]|uniref:hypothetical protein n=1 Tax=Myxosarcina sp. GI1 TaxID=1541065 RepID=UPI00055F9DB7|nr:hypothetical protein [Myxosarcina sp. GI1]
MAIAKIIQIVPRVPPATDGVGDYALNLARKLRQDREIDTHFIVGDRTWTGANTLEGFSISKLTSSTAKSLSFALSQKQAEAILLHYVGYGYAKRGCPTWLVNGLQNWRDFSPKSQLVTMFHEVYAAGEPPWTSAFWLFWLQKKLAARLVQLSDRVLTNKKLYSQILNGLSRGKHLDIPALPVFSNIGEARQLSRLSERQPWLVVFGGRNNRKKAYLESHSKISLVCQILGIEQIIDIGTPTGLSLSDLNGIPIIEKGKLPKDEINRIFLKSRGGFLDYNPEYLAKSGIFAAYCAYGLVPFNAKGSHLEIDGIKSGRHYLVANCSLELQGGMNELQAIADRAYGWYQTHNLASQAQVFASQMSLCHSL